MSATSNVLVTETTVDIFLLGVLTVPNARGGRGVTLLETKMSAPTKGLGASAIEASKKMGQIFFGVRGIMVFMNSHTGYGCSRVHILGVYLLTKVQTGGGWFNGRCGKLCQTSVDASSFAPGIPSPFLSGPKDVEYIVPIVIGDTQESNLQAVLKVSYYGVPCQGGDPFSLSITHSFPTRLLSHGYDREHAVIGAQVPLF